MSRRVPVGALAWIGVLALNRERGSRPGFNSRVRPRPRCEGPGEAPPPRQEGGTERVAAPATRGSQASSGWREKRRHTLIRRSSESDVLVSRLGCSSPGAASPEPLPTDSKTSVLTS